MKAALAAAVGIITLAGPVIVPAVAATAAPSTTIYGPAHAGYGRTITITGRTSPVNASVEVYLRSAGQAKATGHQVVSDATGRYTISFVATANEAYYAIANGVRSRTVRTPLVQLSCTTSGPAFPKFPLPLVYDNHSGFAAYADFEATNAGLWAGVTWNDLQHAGVIEWRSGHPVKVLADYAYKHTSSERGVAGSIRVVGVSAGGAVVAAVQRTTKKFQLEDSVGRVYANGKTYALKASPNWASVTPIGITASGAIVGWVRAGNTASGKYDIVTWADPRAGYRIVVQNGSQRPDPVVDGAGEIAYSSHDGSMARLTSGRTVVLQSPAGRTSGLFVTASATSRSVYGVDEVGSSNEVDRWDLSSTGSSIRGRVVVPSAAGVRAAGPRGDLVTGTGGQQHRLFTATGGYLDLPAELSVAVANPGEAISASGTVAYTSRSDGLPHFFRCT